MFVSLYNEVTLIVHAAAPPGVRVGTPGLRVDPHPPGALLLLRAKRVSVCRVSFGMPRRG